MPEPDPVSSADRNPSPFSETAVRPPGTTPAADTVAATGATGAPAATGEAAPSSGPIAPAAGRRVLEKMLDRLFASLASGPSLNCRPHRSRQRVDLAALAALEDVEPAEALRTLLGADRQTTLRAKVVQPKKTATHRDDPNDWADQPRPAAHTRTAGKGSPSDRPPGAPDDHPPRAARAAAADTARVNVVPDEAPAVRKSNATPPQDPLASQPSADGQPTDEPLTDEPLIDEPLTDQPTNDSPNAARRPAETLGDVERRASAPAEPSDEKIPRSDGVEGRSAVVDPSTIETQAVDRSGIRPTSEAPTKPASDEPTSVPAPQEPPVETALPGKRTATPTAEDRWDAQSALLQKLHIIAEDARTYEQDTGVHVLNVGFPLLSLPPSFNASTGGRQSSRRVLAPVAFIPVSLTLRRGATRSVEIACRGDGVDLVQPNTALLAWLQRQSGRPTETLPELFADEKGEEPWRELRDLVERVCHMVDLPVPPAFAAEPAIAAEPAAGAAAKSAADSPASKSADGPSAAPPAVAAPEGFKLVAAPRTEDQSDGAAIVLAGVLGLFPMANQGLLRDVQEMIERPAELNGPVASFIRLGDLLDTATPRAVDPARATSPTLAADAPAEDPANALPVGSGPAGATAARSDSVARDFSDERLVTLADPCQSRAVRLARQSGALVIHGPPGTGKSQTIANIIGDHLARGQRVLFVCEKRTALDVVADRLEHMGLGHLAGVVHDPQRDQRELYKKIRDQLELLTEAKGHPRAASRLGEIDDELRQLHSQMAAYQQSLNRADVQSGLSFHDLVGQWLSSSPTTVVRAELPPSAVADTDEVTPLAIDETLELDKPIAAELAKLPLADLLRQEHATNEMFGRGRKVGYAKNPWTSAVGIALPAYLARPVEQNRAAMQSALAGATKADETDLTRLPLLPPFLQKLDLSAQADARLKLVDQTHQALDQIPPDVLDRWAGRDLESIRVARAQLGEIQPYVAALRQQPLDAELADRFFAAAGRELPAVNDLIPYRDAAKQYGDHFATSMQWVEQIRAKAPQAKWPVVARWIATDTASASAALRKLEPVAALAERAAALPLDGELAAQYRRQPFDLAQLIRWQPAIENYLAIANSMLGFLHGAKKKAAAPVVEFFGLGLSAESATRVKAFLAGLRGRLETWEAARPVLNEPALAGPALPEDGELFGSYLSSLAVLRAAADLQRQALPAGATAADPTSLVNQMIAEEFERIAPTFQSLQLPPTLESSQKTVALMNALSVRVVLQTFNENTLDAPTPDDLMDDHDLNISLTGHQRLFDLAIATSENPLLSGVWQPLGQALVHRDQLEPMLSTLGRSQERAGAILACNALLADTQLIAPDWLARADNSLRAGESLARFVQPLVDRLASLEDVIRVRETLATLPTAMRPAAQSLLGRSAERQAGWNALRRDVLAGEIRRRLATDSNLQTIDGHQLSAAFERYRQLQEKKRDFVRQMIVDQWLHTQQERLISENGTKLSAAGAELKRRLLLRGERAMRLRQVVARGRQIEGGDPLFDVCPVWMVSPETAAQVFPREPIFDVVVFDEASQCRLEEALPVLTRGRRVVIAGDPKQLPPTRFFESAAAASEEEVEPTSDQEWFEQQQGEVEDLLTAALSLDAQQSYLDVHYRSKTADLIEFSNVNFYNRRLQPIPGHPSRRPKQAPIRLVRVEGIYEKRQNEAEADRVVQIVAELLASKSPPSIGIACFNMTQRDLIVEKLDDRAGEEPSFARKLSEARERIGEGAFEGLFVKNLENVQGDERDHMIISTTYGPDKAGRFYRRFGPLAMPGGGRRLNVLVTRARQQVHLVSSIPPEAYRTLPAPEEGQTPGGGWLLFSYLKFADDLTAEYERSAAPSPDRRSTKKDAVAEDDAAAKSDTVVNEALAGDAPAKGDAKADGAAATAEPAGVADPGELADPVTIAPTRAPSAFAEALAEKITSAYPTRADVYWGNDGFCVDLSIEPAESSPSGRRKVASPIGVLCDAARFAPSDDLIEWDVFRTGVLESQGWTLQRLWTPHFFRDPQQQTAAIAGDGA